MIYQHPLAYLLGLEGIALLRAFAGQYDREFTEARLAEIRSLLDSADQLGEGGTARAITTTDGYRAWAESYDQADNQMIDLEQPIVWEILDGFPPGIALDAACGTGRHAARLAALGHKVIGFDSSSDMLAKAQAKIPNGQFHKANLSHLPVPDEHVAGLCSRSDPRPRLGSCDGRVRPRAATRRAPGDLRLPWPGRRHRPALGESGA